MILERRKTPRPVKVDDFFVPALCEPEALLVLVVLAELLG